MKKNKKNITDVNISTHPTSKISFMAIGLVEFVCPVLFSRQY